MRLKGLYIIITLNLGLISAASANFGKSDTLELIDIDPIISEPRNNAPIKIPDQNIEWTDVDLGSSETTSSEPQANRPLPRDTQPITQEPSGSFTDSMGYSPKDDKLNSTYEKLVKSGAINKVALHNAFKFYEKNQSNKGLSSKHMAIVDYTKPSNVGRYFWVNLETGKIEHTLKVAHGSGSGGGSVPAMCNGQNGSNATPCGFHKYGDPYISGKNGLSIKMHGLQSINSNSESRAIVAHAAAYVSGSRGMGGSSYSAIVNNSGSLINAVRSGDEERFNRTLPSSIRNDGRVTPASANTSSIGRSQGCHAFGGEDYAKIVPQMKDVLSYNYFGEGTEGPTKTAFTMPRNGNRTAVASHRVN